MWLTCFKMSSLNNQPSVGSSYHYMCTDNLHKYPLIKLAGRGGSSGRDCIKNPHLWNKDYMWGHSICIVHLPYIYNI